MRFGREVALRAEGDDALEEVLGYGLFEATGEVVVGEDFGWGGVVGVFSEGLGLGVCGEGGGKAVGGEVGLKELFEASV